jgi:hypothetical protein
MSSMMSFILVWQSAFYLANKWLLNSILNTGLLEVLHILLCILLFLSVRLQNASIFRFAQACIWKITLIRSSDFGFTSSTYFQ